jgi:hypothetical protein
MVLTIWNQGHYTQGTSQSSNASNANSCTAASQRDSKQSSADTSKKVHFDYPDR